MKQVKQAIFRAVKGALIGAAFLGWMGLSFTAVAAQTKLTVSATVLKRATLKVLSQPGSVMITSTDIERGYIDVPTPSQVAVRSNSLSGYLLVFEIEGDFVSNALVRGMGTEVQLGPNGGVVPQPAEGRGVGNTTHQLGFRFMLSSSARQGTHAWPLQVSVVPR